MVLCTLATAAPQITVAEIVAIPGATPGVSAIVSLDADDSGAWVGGVILPLGPFGDRAAIYGVVPALGATTPGIVRLPQTLSGVAQRALSSPRVRGASIAYLARDNSSRASAWVDDQLITSEGDSVGSTGLSWNGFYSVQLGPPGRFYVTGSASGNGPFAPGVDLVVEYPSGSVLLADGDTLPGLGSAQINIGDIEVSPNGEHWAAVITFDTDGVPFNESAVLVDGALHRFANGAAAMTGENGGFAAGAGTAQPWEDFRTAFVSNDLDVTLGVTTASGHIVVRNDIAAFVNSNSNFHQILRAADAAGNALVRQFHGPALGLSLEYQSLDRTGVLGIDADGDGTVDSGWGFSTFGSDAPAAVFGENGRVLAIASLVDPTGNPVTAVVEAKIAQPVEVVCAGVPNQSGRGARLRLYGSDSVVLNHLALTIGELPASLTTVLPLLSRTTAMTPMAGGGIGTLCLGGSIGRGVPFTVASSFTNQFSIPIFTHAIPQANGSVAAVAGETWYLQAWYRDSVAGVATSNFSEAISIQFN